MYSKVLFLLFMFFVNTIYAGELRILSYNVENLFDPSYASIQKDWTFMPKSHPDKEYRCSQLSWGAQTCLNTDWTVEKYNQKINNIVKVIKSYQTLPDMLALMEIEEEHVVSRLAEELGYKHFKITNSPDTRGVNVALLFNTTNDVQYIKSNEYKLDSAKPSRNILAVEFIVNFTPLIIYVNHWPSQSNPVAERIKAAQLVKNVINQNLKEQPNARIVVLGDFNTIETDRPDPFDVFIRSSLNPLHDVQDLYLNSKQVSPALKRQQPLMSYFYTLNMTWNKLDRFFINKNLLSDIGLHADITSYVIHAPNFAKSAYYFNEHARYPVKPDDSRYGSMVNNVPIMSNFQTNDLNNIGYSDHFPIALKLLW